MKPELSPSRDLPDWLSRNQNHVQCSNAQASGPAPVCGEHESTSAQFAERSAFSTGFSHKKHFPLALGPFSFMICIQLDGFFGSIKKLVCGLGIEAKAGQSAHDVGRRWVFGPRRRTHHGRQLTRLTLSWKRLIQSVSNNCSPHYGSQLSISRPMLARRFVLQPPLSYCSTKPLKIITLPGSRTPGF